MRALTLAGVLLVFGLVTLERQGWKPRWRRGLLLGDASFALYLIHAPVASVVCKVAIAIGLAGLLGASIAWLVALGVSIATHCSSTPRSSNQFCGPHAADRIGSLACSPRPSLKFGRWPSWQAAEIGAAPPNGLPASSPIALFPSN